MLALVFVAVIFTVITGVLSFAFGAAKGTESYRRDRALHFAADAALEVGVEMVKQNTTLGETSPSSPPVGTCAMTLPVTGAHDPGGVFAAGAQLTVTCGVTPGVAVSGGLDVDGGQFTRDVSFDVVCRVPNGYKPEDPLACAAGNPVVLDLGHARVRYDIDPGHADPLKRARVPKVVSWEITR